ncbi:MAG: hypothetical protein IJU69_04370 [Bacteroidales bacterium]|nr:hypothetical protein [Bacteroidales bacterium]
MKALYKILYPLAALLVLGACTKTDELSSRIDDLEKRMSELEQWQQRVNSDIGTLRASLEVLEGNEKILNVKDIVESGKTVGVEIVFEKAGSKKIYDGKQGDPGKEGHSPEIAVKADTDGILYWTVDGKWLLDASGQKVRATGKDGQDGKTPADGKTPQLKIVDDYWYVSYDGTNWTKLGKATGKDGGDSIFSAVYMKDGQLVLELRGGETYYVPVGTLLGIEFDSEDLVFVDPGKTKDIHFTVTSSTGEATVEVISQGNVSAKLSQDGLTGVISVKSLYTTLDGDTDKVIVLVTNGEKVIMKTLRFEIEGLEVMEGSVTSIGAEGGKAELLFLSNIGWEVEIPAEAQSWISLSSTKALVAHNVMLDIAANEGMRRSAVVRIKGKDSSLYLDYTISQAGSLSVLEVETTATKFTSPAFEGSSIKGSVNWGDGTSSDYTSGISKTYTDSGKSHKVTFALSGAGAFTFSKLTGVTSINVTEY